VLDEDGSAGVRVGSCTAGGDNGNMDGSKAGGGGGNEAIGGTLGATCACLLVVSCEFTLGI
jgi:hypothetical protein